jgi:xylose dehydrogenase (NAD/NADP)
MPLNTSRTVRWGILSTAQINDEIIPAFDGLELASLEAVASRDAGRARTYADSRGIPRSHGSYEALISDPDIDCLYISLPNSMHAQWAERALNAGKHVLCEKPLTPSVGEAKRLFAAARRNDRILMEGFMYRHHPQTLRIRELIGEGAIGELQVMRSSFNFKTAQPSTDVRYDPELAGGALLDVGSYCVSLHNFVAGGSPVEVNGLARNTRSGVEEGFVGQMLYSGDVLAQFDASLFTPLDIGFTAVGSEGRLHVQTPWYPHKPPQQIVVERGDERRVEDCAGDNSYRLEVINLSRAALGLESPLVTESETLINLETLERLAASADQTTNKYEGKDND